MTAKNGYIPALSYDALTRFYDPLIRWFLRETTFKNALIEQAQIATRHRVLDVGCGTGTLTLMAKHAAPAAEVVGIDGDPKILAIAMLVVCGFLFAQRSTNPSGFLDRPVSADLLTAFGAALVPVIFAYGGWQTSTFIAGEIKEPRKNLPRGLILGVTGVVVLYLAANVVYTSVLGTTGLAASSAPASDVMRSALGDFGARLIAAGIAISTAGFLSQSMLTAPRVYFAMAKDGLFFEQVGMVHPQTRAPIVAIALQGVLAIVIALVGEYDRILNYVVSIDMIFFGLTACCIFVFRKREAPAVTRVPGHPITTIIFIAICWLVVINTVYRYPQNTLIGIAIMIAGIPAYWFWRQRSSR
jgi:APA family basic amino acid/polyamine antiporter